MSDGNTGEAGRHRCDANELSPPGVEIETKRQSSVEMGGEICNAKVGRCRSMQKAQSEKAEKGTWKHGDVGIPGVSNCRLCLVVTLAFPLSDSSHQLPPQKQETLAHEEKKEVGLTVKSSNGLASLMLLNVFWRDDSSDEIFWTVALAASICQSREIHQADGRCTDGRVDRWDTTMNGKLIVSCKR